MTFAIGFYFWNVVVCLIGWPSILLPRRWALPAARVWGWGHLLIARWTLGLR